MLRNKRLKVANLNREQRISDGTGDLATLNNEFHEIIYQGGLNASIPSVARSFHKGLLLFERLNSLPGQTEYAFHEHDRIVEAIVDPTHKVPTRSCEGRRRRPASSFPPGRQKSDRPNGYQG